MATWTGDEFVLKGRAGLRLAFELTRDASGHAVVQAAQRKQMLLTGAETPERARRMALERLHEDLVRWQAQVVEAILASVPKPERILHIQHPMVVRFVYLQRPPSDPPPLAHLWHHAGYATKTCCQQDLGQRWMVVPVASYAPEVPCFELPIAQVCQLCRVTVEAWEHVPTWQSAPPI